MVARSAKPWRTECTHLHFVEPARPPGATPCVRATREGVANNDKVVELRPWTMRVSPTVCAVTQALDLHLT